MASTQTAVDLSAASANVHHCSMIVAVGGCGQDRSGQAVSTSGFWRFSFKTVS